RIRKEHRNHFSLLNSLSYLPYILTGIDIIKRGNARRRRLTLLIWSSALFLSGIYIFNAPYIPFLTSKGVTNSEIFLINIASSATSILVYYFVSKGKFLKAGSSYKNSIIIRGIAYVLVSASAFVSFMIFYSNIIGYALVGISYALWNVSISIAIYRSIRKRNTAFMLGVWSAINAMASAISSEVSGVIYSFIGFPYIPIIAFSVILVSYVTFSMGVE
ncbi:MAG: hypothetical protein QXP36_08825, partial [Conexivisphaerales archaeon]